MVPLGDHKLLAHSPDENSCIAQRLMCGFACKTTFSNDVGPVEIVHAAPHQHRPARLSVLGRPALCRLGDIDHPREYTEQVALLNDEDAEQNMVGQRPGRLFQRNLDQANVLTFTVTSMPSSSSALPQ